MECVSAKMVVSKSKSPPFYFSTDLLLLTAIARIFFNCWSEAFGVTCVPRPEQLVRSTPLLPCGMPKDARKERWHVRGGRVSRDSSSGDECV